MSPPHPGLTKRDNLVTIHLSSDILVTIHLSSVGSCAGDGQHVAGGDPAAEVVTKVDCGAQSVSPHPDRLCPMLERRFLLKGFHLSSSPCPALLGVRGDPSSPSQPVEVGWAPPGAAFPGFWDLLRIIWPMPTGHGPFPAPSGGTDSTEQIRGKKFGRFSQLFRLQRDVLGWEGTADMKGNRKHLIETPLAGGRDITPRVIGIFGCSWIPVLNFSV